jgi:hypothetical protein
VPLSVQFLQQHINTAAARTLHRWTLHKERPPSPPPAEYGPPRSFLANTFAEPSFSECPVGAVQADILEPAMGVACWRVQGKFTYSIGEPPSLASRCSLLVFTSHLLAALLHVCTRASSDHRLAHTTRTDMVNFPFDVQTFKILLEDERSELRLHVVIPLGPVRWREA